MIKRSKPDRDGHVKLTFSIPDTAPEGAVSLVGCFNAWDPYAHPLKARANGRRSAVVSVPAGDTVRFRYLGENGRWFDDEDADALHHDGGLLHL
ncbi:hypothetical protein CLV63_119112 [Murinocardiopsis flavida]|uniref:AMP-activated protein kinase-like protein n=1 Tax=Murinocardiopsis flavida TaxID=645275 RepID=A0A2P8D3N1_9ACTN|nr:isoamylase early set domain-containing protein [Murinocardiopsis flavida]PSK91831.1 hypothetical protein CLV63_119112 [Murinocardiopsis flavida]